MEPWLVTVLVCGAYLGLSLGMGIASRRTVTGTVAGYVAADRSMNVLVLYFVLGASVFSSFAFLGGPGWAYSRGAAAFYILAYGTVGMVPLYFIGPRARRVGARLNFVTQAELLVHRFANRPLGIVLAIVSVAACIPYLTLQMKGAGYILSVISEGRIPEWAGALVTYGVVMTYVLTSGVMGVGWTNTFQGIFMLVVAWFMGLYLPWKLYGGVGAMFTQIAASDFGAMLTAPGVTTSGEPWNWWAYSSAIIVSAMGLSMWPHLFMKSYAAKSDRALRLTVVLYPTFQLFLVPILLIGFAGVIAYPNVAPADTIVPYILTQIEFPALIVGLVCAGALAASMSTGDALLHAAASIGIRDGLAPLVSHAITDQQQRSYIRILVVLLGAVSYYFAVVSDVSLVALLLGSYGAVAQILPLMFAAFYWPRATGVGALSGLLAGILVSVFFLAAPELRPFPIHEGVFGLVANIVVLTAVSLNTRPEPMAKLRLYTGIESEVRGG